MELDLRLLRAFVAVAEELHFGRAAGRLHLTQPALSKQVRRLERELGLELFRRDSRHVALSPAGAALLDDARSALAAADRALETARAAASGERGALRIGFLANAAAELTPRILGAFQAEHPHVGVTMRQFDFTDPLAGVVSGETDAAFVRGPVDPGEEIGLALVLAEPRVLVLSDRHPLAGAPSLTVEALLDEPFVARLAPPAWRDFWLAVDHRGGAPVRIGAEVATVDECFEAILAGRGVAFTQASSQRFYARPGLAFVPVPELTPTTVALAWPRAEEVPLVSHLVEVARAEAARLVTGPPVVAAA